jgi:hypothetical protein
MMPHFGVCCVAVAVCSLEEPNVAVMDALHGAVPGNDVETAGTANRDATGVNARLLAVRHYGANQVAGGEPLDLLDPGQPQTREAVAIRAGAGVGAAPGRLDHQNR